MVKVFFGEDYGYTLHCALKELKKNLNSEEFTNIEKFDAYKDTITNIVSSCESISLFIEKKTVVVYNAYFFGDSKTRKSPVQNTEKDFKLLEGYLNCPSSDTDLYFIVPSIIVKTGSPNVALCSPGVILQSCTIPSKDDYILLSYKIAKEQNKDIDKEASDLLYERTKGDYLAFMNNLNKLFCYTNKVKESDVEELVYRPLEDKAYLVVSSLIKGDINQALKIYRDLDKGGFDSILLLSAFATQINNLAMIKYLSTRGYSKEDIANEMKVKPGKVYYTLKDLNNIPYETLLTILSDISLMEKDIKINLDDPKMRVELFITLFGKKYLRK